jgi:hypothetical protein
MADLTGKLKVDVNHNPTKKGIKVQFVLPQTLEGDAKAQATQKLQTKLNQGLSQYNLTVSQDTDVPYSNVIGFLISFYQTYSNWTGTSLLPCTASGGECSRIYVLDFGYITIPFMALSVFVYMLVVSFIYKTDK